MPLANGQVPSSRMPPATGVAAPAGRYEEAHSASRLAPHTASCACWSNSAMCIWWNVTTE